MWPRLREIAYLLVPAMGVVLAVLALATLFVQPAPSWLLQPMGRLMGAHLQTLADYPPVQGGKSFDMSNAIEEFVKKARQ